MKMDKIANSKNDEFYTPKYAVLPIINYLKEKKYEKIWCPFDTKESNFVKILNEYGFEIIHTHINNDEDFFDLDLECDCIVSNPPYSLKNEVFERLFLLEKPFAMLVGVVGMFESKKRFNLFKYNNFEIMYLDKRVSYLKSYQFNKTELNPPFQSVYICRNLLPTQMCFEEIDKKNV